jgi:hypothetical protein
MSHFVFGFDPFCFTALTTLTTHPDIREREGTHVYMLIIFKSEPLPLFWLL